MTHHTRALTLSGPMDLGNTAPAVTTEVIVVVPAIGGNVAVVQLS